MKNIEANQPFFFSELTSKFPSTRYQGSKTKLADWIWEQIKELSFETCLDAFGGTGSVAYRLKQENKEVTYNDLLKFNYYLGLGLIENKSTRLTIQDVDYLLKRHPGIEYPSIVEDNFTEIYFTDEENKWIDQVITNIGLINGKYKFALAFFALCQACVIKRPYNLFHRKNLYIRFADVERSFGNKTSWDKPFSEWFRIFAEEANNAVFDNGKNNVSLNLNSNEIDKDFDLVYIDPPYISNNGTAVDYRGFYHFLEGLSMYNQWFSNIDMGSKHRRLIPTPNDWTAKKKIYNAFDNIFNQFKNSIIVVSYRSDGIPAVSELTEMLKKYKSDVEVRYFGSYKYALSTNIKSEEVILIAA
jgi:adenine-specific DNA-methyltransferase